MAFSRYRHWVGAPSRQHLYLCLCLLLVALAALVALRQSFTCCPRSLCGGVIIPDGELLDKISILDIKLTLMRGSPEKARNVQFEYNYLTGAGGARKIAADEAAYRSLKDANLRLWRLEDAVRTKEKTRTFDEEFIQ